MSQNIFQLSYIAFIPVLSEVKKLNVPLVLVLWQLVLIVYLVPSCGPPQDAETSVQNFTAGPS